MIILAVDLAFRKSGWVLLDTDRMRLLAYGTFTVPKKGTSGDQCALFVERLEEVFLAANDLYEEPAVVAYETPGGAGISSRTTRLQTQRLWGMAQGLLEYYVETAGPAKTREWDQSEVKNRIVGNRRASKAQVRCALQILTDSGEVTDPDGKPIDLSNWSNDETDALAVAICHARLMFAESMEVLHD